MQVKRSNPTFHLQIEKTQNEYLCTQLTGADVMLAHVKGPSADCYDGREIQSDEWSLVAYK